MLKSNLKKYEKELEKLILDSQLLYFSLLIENNVVDKETKEKLKKEINPPKFKDKYEEWYTLSMQLIKQILPDRYEDFISQYKKEKRKTIDVSTYTISDYLIGLVINYGVNKIVDPSAAIPKFEIQKSILESVKQRFHSSLYDITHLLQADLFDDELESAKELLKKGFIRAAGALSGVVLEKHLKQVCNDHKIIIRKKNPSISDYNDNLKKEEIIDISTWRQIQLLADLRNLCDHDKNREPTKEEIEDLINGVNKIIKTVF